MHIHAVSPDDSIVSEPEPPKQRGGSGDLGTLIWNYFARTKHDFFFHKCSYYSVCTCQLGGSYKFFKVWHDLPQGGDFK